MILRCSAACTLTPELRSTTMAAAFIEYLQSTGARCRAENGSTERRNAMATKAYILIKVKTGRTKEVLHALKKLTGVEQAHSCFGQPDIFLFISTHDERSLSDVVITKIHQIEGVEETDTHIVADT
jgi:DNA-binding Lrp family transcriptional regulator